MIENIPLLLAAAVSLFIAGAVFELVWRANKYKLSKHERPYHGRIDHALYHLKKHDIEKLTKELYMDITGSTEKSAEHDLKKLVELGVLTKKGRGKNIHYVFAKPEK